jgi:hypothetical protein
MPYYEENYGDVEGQRFEFWEINEDIMSVISFRIKKMEQNIQKDFKVNSSGFRLVHKKVHEFILQERIQIGGIFPHEGYLRILWLRTAL